MTTLPARLMNLRGHGIAVGNAADLIVLDAAMGADALAGIAEPVLGFKGGRQTFAPLRRGYARHEAVLCCGMATVFRGFDQAALDREYNARASVPDFPAEMARYEALSAAARDALPPVVHVYDPPSGNALDWFAGRPGGPRPAPVFLWVHGGYWRALSRMEQSCVAPGLAAAGVSVAVMDYTLVPHATLDEIVRQVRAACAWVAARAEGPVFIGGSSAGGHLCGMVLAEGPDVRGAVLLSGLYDMEPVRLSHVNAWMQLDEAAAHRNSPLRHVPPAPRARLLLSYGANETAEFKRQTDEYAAAWAVAGGQARVLPAPGHNHFSVAAALGDGADPLCQAAIAFMQD